MDDRYLFRGKRLDGTTWFYGYLMQTEANGISHAWIFHNFKQISGNKTEYERVRVDPATIGQCTGLRDNSGTLMFEGDIITRGSISFTIVRDDKNARFIGVSEFSWNINRGEYTKGQGNTLCYLSDYLKIIGNIHELTNTTHDTDYQPASTTAQTDANQPH